MFTAVRICELLADRVADRERRAHGALGVVLVRDRCAEDGHHRVADELLDRAAVPLELGAELRVVRRERRADVFGVEPFRACRRADEVGEEDRHDLPLLARGRGGRNERGAAHPAEAGAVGILLAAGRTRDHVRTVDLSVEAGELGSVHGADGGLPPRDARLVRAELRRADAGAGAGLARDRGRRPRPHPGADRLGEDARGVPLGDRPLDGDAGTTASACSTSRRSRRSTTTSSGTCAARSPASGRSCGSPSARATRRRRSARRCSASRRTS